MPPTTRSSNPEITLPSIGKPKWKRTFTSIDIKPSTLSPMGRKNKIDSEVAATTCLICNSHETRYTCPRCLTPFCSVECYRKHDLPLPPKGEGDGDRNNSSSNNNGSNNNSGGGGGMCTEIFYRKKVKEVCDLDVRTENNMSQMKDILTRSFYDSPNSNDDIAQEGCELTEDELVELATHVLSIQDLEKAEESDEAKNESYNKIPEHIRLKFEQAVQRGELSHLIKEWHPYWLPDYNATSSENCIDSDYYVEDNGNDYVQTLDEKLLSIPQLVKLQRSSKRIELQYNICELIYNTAMILRLYNGGKGDNILKFASAAHRDDDIDSIFVSIHSANVLYSQSFVLSKDERYTNINEVLMDCVINKKHGQNTAHQYGVAATDDVDWRVLMNDSICICRSKRMVLRVLFDTIDILNDGLRSIRKVESKKLTRELKLLGECDTTGKKKDMKLAKKKIEYYISWTASNWDLVGNDTVNDIKVWTDDWILKEEDRINIASASIMASVPAIKDILRQNKSKINLSINFDEGAQDTAPLHDEPLLTAISTKKKNHHEEKITCE